MFFDFLKFNIKYNKWKTEQVEWTERIEAKRRQLEIEIKEFTDRKFTLEKSKLSTLTLNGKSKKK
jgi:hypothetical protein